MANNPANPPYFDGLFQRLASDDVFTVAAFSRHVHWGYWNVPSRATCSPEEYGTAAENLCRVVCDAAEIRDGMRILDVGCGFGDLSVFIVFTCDTRESGNLPQAVIVGIVYLNGVGMI